MNIKINLSRKCKYAIKAIFELAIRDSALPVKIQDIAASQEIPPRFLEIILAELKHGGFVESQRGSEGGYFLAKPAKKITVGQVLSFLQKGNTRKETNEKQRYTILGDYAFSEMIQKVNEAVSSIYDHATFAGLVEKELKIRNKYVPNYAI